MWRVGQSGKERSIDAQLQRKINDMIENYQRHELARWERERKKLLYYEQYYTDVQVAKVQLERRLRELNEA